MQNSLFKQPSCRFIMSSFSANNLCTDDERKSLEARYKHLLEVTDKFNRQSVSYQLSKKDIVHSWLKYKEGFSATLVNTLLDEMEIKQNDLILDPFIGSGTTAIVCQLRGINVIGYDIMPLSAISIKAKTDIFNYNIPELQQLLSDIVHMDIPDNFSAKTPYIKITRDAYPEKNARFLAYIQQWNENSAYSPDAKNLLTLCVINSLEICSYTSKSGQYLGWDCRSNKIIESNKKRAEKGQRLIKNKYVRDIIHNSQDIIIEELRRAIKSIEYIQKNTTARTKTMVDFSQCSALYKLPLLKENSIHGVITSPPYCNRYDYTRTYALELVYLGLGEQEIKAMRQNLLTCTVENKSKISTLKEYYDSLGRGKYFDYIYSEINKNKVFNEIMDALHQRKEYGDINNSGIIRMVEGYFTELAFIYAELYRVCKQKAQVAFVNDNVRYGGEVIPVDFLSSSFAEQFGFKIKTIYTLRQQKGNSSQQMAKFGRVPLRKGITIWEK